MSVLVKGMKMPRYCAECDAVNDEELLCPFTIDDCENYFSVRNRNCPLSPVPPHGRLGDLDALQKQIDFARNSGMIGKTAYYKLQKLIKEAPTIIPAEEGEA